MSVEALVAGAVVLDGMLFGSKKTDAVVQNVISLDFIGEVPAGNEFESRSRSHSMILLDQVLCAFC